VRGRINFESYRFHCDIFFKKNLKKFKKGAGGSPRISSRIRKFSYSRRGPRGGVPPIQRVGGGAEGHPARWAGGRSPRYISPYLPLNFHFIQQKPEKKGRKERKREKEAAKPCSHVDLEAYSHSSRIIT
jgi:hypothetical protein